MNHALVIHNVNQTIQEATTSVVEPITQTDIIGTRLAESAESGMTLSFALRNMVQRKSAVMTMTISIVAMNATQIKIVIGRQTGIIYVSMHLVYVETHALNPLLPQIVTSFLETSNAPAQSGTCLKVVYSVMAIKSMEFALKRDQGITTAGMKLGIEQEDIEQRTLMELAIINQL